MKSKLFKFSIISLFFLLLFGCKKDEDKKSSLATLTTKTPTSITTNNATVGGFISSDGGASITERGVCYSAQNQNPSVTDAVITEGSGTGNFDCILSELIPGTKYYVRAFASNAVGTGYGNSVSFTTETNQPPIVTFIANPTSGPVPLTVNFTDQSTNSPTSWLWEFGDGGYSTLRNPSHTYTTPGIYPVLLTVSNIYGWDTKFVDNYINVTNSGNSGTVTDIDGNVYQTVIIGGQEWMAENLKVTHYRNGDEIPNVTETSEWVNLTTGAYCFHENPEAAFYGALYNWYAVNTGNLSPTGWHVPTDAEWLELIDFVGGPTLAGDRLKAKSGWQYNGNGTDNWGFSAFPGGQRGYGGTCDGAGAHGHFWTSSEQDATIALGRLMYYGSWEVTLYGDDKKYGLSIRCVKDN